VLSAVALAVYAASTTNEPTGTLSPTPAPVPAAAPRAQPREINALATAVRRHDGALHHKCNARLSGRSARVQLRLTIAPSGSVSSATATPQPPSETGLASCVESAARDWRFSAASGASEVQIPFVFAIQSSNIPAPSPGDPLRSKGKGTSSSGKD
jgi:TonB family protein